jgi:SAM-dependent methyltransferase
MTALQTYEAFAEDYDNYTADHDYDDWMTTVEGLARRHGLRGRRVVDVACGTGKSHLPMLRKGYHVAACDLSPGMVARAAAKLRGPTAVDRLFVADMRRLPDLATADLVTCIGDALNYLTRPDDLVAAFRSMRRALRPGGLCLFDVNTLRTYGELFEAAHTVERDDATFAWTGRRLGIVQTGGSYEARIEVKSRTEDRRRTHSIHVQRHHPGHVIAQALGTADLELVAGYGAFSTGEIEHVLDERRHTKAVYVARRPEGGSP